MQLDMQKKYDAMAACITNGLSAVCELLHMNIFSINGIGNYSLDALSSHFEALSDSMISE